MCEFDIKWRKGRVINRGGSCYINQNQLLKLRMKNLPKIISPREEVYSETCSGDFESLQSPQRSIRVRRRPTKERKTKEPLNPPATQIRLFRFKLKHARKTLRIPLFQQELLNLPLRFTRRINEMELDNDVETDEQMAGSQAQRCQNWLKEAIAAQGHLA